MSMIIIQVIGAVLWGAIWFCFGYAVASYVGSRKDDD